MKNKKSLTLLYIIGAAYFLIGLAAIITYSTTGKGGSTFSIVGRSVNTYDVLGETVDDSAGDSTGADSDQSPAVDAYIEVPVEGPGGEAPFPLEDENTDITPDDSNVAPDGTEYIENPVEGPGGEAPFGIEDENTDITPDDSNVAPDGTEYIENPVEGPGGEAPSGIEEENTDVPSADSGNTTPEALSSVDSYSDADAIGTYTVIISKNLRVHIDPNINSEVVGAISPQSKGTVYADKNGWAYIKNAAGGVEGYVASDMIEIVLN